MTGVFVWVSHHPFATHLGCQDNGGCPAQPPACCEAARRAEAAAKMVQDHSPVGGRGNKKNGRKNYGDYKSGLIDMIYSINVPWGFLMKYLVDFNGL